MALGATIYKVQLSVADMDRNHYGDYQLTLARHPSETDERMMVRLLAFILNATDQLSFTRGLCVDDEPELWQIGLDGRVELWIEVGLPDEKRLRKACGRAEQVLVYAYGGRAVELWWQKSQSALERCHNLRVIELPSASTRSLAALVRRSFELQATVQDGEIWLSLGEEGLALQPLILRS